MLKKTYTLLHNKKMQYLLIVMYSLALVLITKWGGLYGSEVDWLSQHTVFPDIFRNHYYETGSFAPKFLFNTGAGQNAYNFAYYGLLSPFVILSYFLPSVDMVTYITVTSITLFVLTGVLTKKFVSSHLGDYRGFWAAIILLSIPSVNFHFHRHIMFVWYFPFLLLALIGLDRYFDKNKPGLFVISTALIIFTNYLYAVPCLLVLYVYAIYCIFKKTEQDFLLSDFLKKVFICTLIFVIPVLMGGILLLPAAHSLLANSRPSGDSIIITDLIFPVARQHFFSSYSVGITFSMFVATIGNLTCKTLKKSDRFLNIALVVIIVCPLVIFALNGFLYIRGKILIPFALLYIYNLFIFIDNLKNKKINYKITIITAAVLGVIMAFSDRTGFINIIGYLAIVVADLLIWHFVSKKPEKIIIYTIIVLLIPSIGVYHSDLTKDEYEKMYYKETGNLVKNIDYDGLYRTNVSYNEYDNSNKLYDSKHYNTSVFSSTYNALYEEFYTGHIGNNTSHPCKLVTSGAKNELFYTFMGTRYIVSDEDPGFMYEKIKSGKHLDLYENKNCYPVVYKSTSVMSESDFDKTKFPYSLVYLMNNTVVNSDATCDYVPPIEKIDVVTEYNFENETERKHQIDLGKDYIGKYLYLTFDVDNKGEYENPDDLYIIINGCKNLLSDYKYIYYNGNNKFEYVIPLEDDGVLDITESKGKFNIKNLEMYTSDAIHSKYEAVDNFKINKKEDSFSCTANAKKGEYLVTTIPYDPNFKAFVNGKETEIITVNKAFMGIKLTEGTNNIRFEYTSAFCTAGYVVSAIGVILFAVLMCYNKIRKRSHKSV